MSDEWNLTQGFLHPTRLEPLLSTVLPAKPPSTRSILWAPSHCRAPASVSPLSGMAFEGSFFLILKVSFQVSPYQRYLPLLGKPVNCPTSQLLSVICRLHTVTLYNTLFIITLSIILPSHLLHLCHSLLCIGPPWSTHPSFLSFLTPITTSIILHASVSLPCWSKVSWEPGHLGLVLSFLRVEHGAWFLGGAQNMFVEWMNEIPKSWCCVFR